MIEIIVADTQVWEFFEGARVHLWESTAVHPDETERTIEFEQRPRSYQPPEIGRILTEGGYTTRYVGMGTVLRRARREQGQVYARYIVRPDPGVEIAPEFIQRPDDRDSEGGKP